MRGMQVAQAEQWQNTQEAWLQATMKSIKCVLCL